MGSELGMSFLPVSEALRESRRAPGPEYRFRRFRTHRTLRPARDSEGQAARLFAAAATQEEKAELQKP